MSDPAPPLPHEPPSVARQQPFWIGGLKDGNGYAERPRATFSPPSLDRILPVLLQHWKAILFCTLIGFLASVAALPLLDTRYLISARVLVLVGREMTPPPTATLKEGSTQIITAKRPEDLGSEIEIMRNPQLFEDVVTALGTDFFLGEPPAISLWQKAKRLARHSIRFVREQVSEVLILLGVRQRVGLVDRVVKVLEQAFTMEEVRKSDVILVQLRMPSPEMGVVVMNRYLSLFLERHIATFRSPQNREFFAAEAERLQRQLQEQEVKLARFKDDNRVWAIAEQTALLLRAKRELGDSLAHSQRDAQEQQSRLAELRRQEASLPADLRLSRVTGPDPVDDKVREQRALVEAQMAQTAVLYGERSPQMLGLRRQLEALGASRRPARGDQETTGINQHLYEVRRDIAATQSQLAGLQARIRAEEDQQAQLEESMRRMAATETTLTEMQRDVARLEREYALYTSRLEDSRISEAMDLAKISNVRVISPPRADPVPVFPPLIWVLAGGTLVGLVGVLGVVFGRDTLYPVVRSRREIEQVLGVAVLASVPHHRAVGR